MIRDLGLTILGHETETSEAALAPAAAIADGVGSLTRHPNA